MTFYEDDRQASAMEVPDYALDIHTAPLSPHGPR
jgi:hypothetical protein